MKAIRNTGRRRVLYPILFIAMVLPMAFQSPSWAHSHEHHDHNPSLDESRPQALKGRSLYQIPSAWTSEIGQKTNLKDLHGTVRVITMAYTRCQSACPILVNDMLAIQQSLPASVRGQVQFTVFSLDSERDTPESLRDYKTKRRLDEATWSLFNGTSSSVRTLAVALGIRYQQDKSGEFSHSNVITLLDADGQIVHQQVGLGLDPTPMSQAILNLFK